MASYNKFQQFVEDLAKKVHNLDADAISIYLTNATPDAAADAVKADLAEISTGSGYTGPVALTGLDTEQTTGTAKMVADDVTVTASGGSVGPFRYVVLFNDTPSSPLDPLIGWWDYGSSITLADGESFTIDFSASNGLLQLA